MPKRVRLLTRISPLYLIEQESACDAGAAWFKRAFDRRALDLVDYKAGIAQIKAAKPFCKDMGINWPGWVVHSVNSYLYYNDLCDDRKLAATHQKFYDSAKASDEPYTRLRLAFTTCRAMVRTQKDWRNRDR